MQIPAPKKKSGILDIRFKVPLICLWNDSAALAHFKYCNDIKTWSALICKCYVRGYKTFCFPSVHHIGAAMPLSLISNTKRAFKFYLYMAPARPFDRPTLELKMLSTIILHCALISYFCTHIFVWRHHLNTSLTFCILTAQLANVFFLYPIRRDKKQSFFSCSKTTYEPPHHACLLNTKPEPRGAWLHFT